MDERALPAGVLGPVDFFAFLRFASICFAVAICFSPFLITDFTDYTEDIWFYWWEISQLAKLNPAKARRREEERDVKATCFSVAVCFLFFLNHR